MEFKFVHAADLHLDSPFRGVPADARLGPVFREATLRAFRRVVGLCLRERVQFLLLAGDLFDSRDRSVRARLALHEALTELDAAGISTFIVHGNHDPLCGSGGVCWPASVKVFGTEWEEAEVRRGPNLLARIQGISYPEERVTENLARRFRRLGPQFTVGLLHANLGGVGTHANYAPCSTADLSASGLDYWALGHVHTRAEAVLPGGGVAVYPGNTQGRHVHEAGERGCMLVEVDGVHARRTFVPTDSVRWHQVGVEISGLETLDALAAEVDEQIREVHCDGLEGHAVRVTLRGRGGLSRELRLPGGLAGLEEHLREVWGGASPPVLVESVVDATGTELELDAVRRAGGLGSTVLNLAATSAPDLLWAEDDLKRLDAALRRAGLPLTRDDGSALTDLAAIRAVELLAEGQA